MSSQGLNNFKHLNALRDDVNALWMNEFKMKSRKSIDMNAIRQLMAKYKLQTSFDLFLKLIKIKFNIPISHVREQDLVHQFADLGLFILEVKAGELMIKHNCLQLLLYSIMTDGVLAHEKQVIRQRINSGSLFSDPKFAVVLDKLLKAVSLEKNLFYSKTVAIILKELAQPEVTPLGEEVTPLGGSDELI